MTASTTTAPKTSGKPAPAQAPKTNEKVAAEQSAFTFDVVKDAEMPKVSRPRSEKPNPLKPMVQESYESNTPRAIAVAEKDVKDAKNMIRRAANGFGIGARIGVSEPVDGKVTITFLGKPLNKREKPAADAPAADASAKDA